MHGEVCHEIGTNKITLPARSYTCGATFSEAHDNENLHAIRLNQSIVWVFPANTCTLLSENIISVRYALSLHGMHACVTRAHVVQRFRWHALGVISYRIDDKKRLTRTQTLNSLMSKHSPFRRYTKVHSVHSHTSLLHTHLVGRSVVSHFSNDKRNAKTVEFWRTNENAVNLI